jgi:hypothetical protein
MKSNSKICSIIRKPARKGANKLLGRSPRLRLIWVDGAYAGELAVALTPEEAGCMIHLMLKRLRRAWVYFEHRLLQIPNVY